MLINNSNDWNNNNTQQLFLVWKRVNILDFDILISANIQTRYAPFKYICCSVVEESTIMPCNLWLVSFRSPFDIIDENPTFLICELFFLTWALLLLGHGKKPQCTYAYDSFCTFRVSLPLSPPPPSCLFIFSNSLHFSFPSYSFTLHFF